MAVTKIWTIKDSLQRVLDYAANPDKTEYDALAQTQGIVFGLVRVGRVVKDAL